MKCKQCGGDFPHRTGSYCGTCQKPGRYVFSVSHAGDSDAGMHPYSDVVTVVVESGDPGGNPGEFAYHVSDCLAQWFDGARVLRVGV